jgi:hypothetical protein
MMGDLPKEKNDNLIVMGDLPRKNDGLIMTGDLPRKNNGLIESTFLHKLHDLHYRLKYRFLIETYL